MDEINPKDYIKPRESRYKVDKITKAKALKAMNNPFKYMKTLPALNEDSYFQHATKIVELAKSFEPDFKLSVESPEAHKMAIRINDYRERQAKKQGEQFKAIDYKDVLKAFEKMRSVYRNLLLYFRGNERGTYDTGKGLYFHGDTGSGKTLAMDVFKLYTGQILQVNSFRKVPASEILDEVYKKGINALDQFIRTPVTYKSINLYIEDFGAGNKTVKFMGNNIEPMGKLIMDRYRYYKEYGTLTHICTNIKPADLSDHFGPRVCSRFSDMFNIVNFNIFDWRKL